MGLGLSLAYCEIHQEPLRDALRRTTGQLIISNGRGHAIGISCAGPKSSIINSTGIKDIIKGHSKKKVTGPYVVGWFLGGQKSTRVGQIFGEILLSCFELPLPRNAQKRDKRNRENNGLGFFCQFLQSL
jgi:hypothetical protein